LENQHVKSKVVVGAHYGLFDWLAQRATATIIVLYLLAMIASVVSTSAPLDRAQWSYLFSLSCIQTMTFVALLAIAYHAWIGMRDIWMDYIKPTGLRLVLHVSTIVFLLGCLGWAVEVLWR
jgi:succinate dehydrogenase / fumarate reductase membrane anchor subunit